MKTSKIKIQQAVLLKISDNKHLLKSLSTWYALKSLYIFGTINNLSQQKHQLADKCFISKRCLDKRLKDLEKLSLIKIQNNTLYIVSESKMLELLGIQPNRIKYYYLKLDQNPEYLLRALIGKDNLYRQEKNIERIILKNNINSGRSIENTKVQEFESLINSLQYRLNYDQQFNPDITIGQFQLAQIFGLMNQESGYYWTKRLEKLGLLKSENRMLEIKACPHKKRGHKIKFHGYVYHSRELKRDVIQMRNKLVFL